MFLSLILWGPRQNLHEAGQSPNLYLFVTEGHLGQHYLYIHLIFIQALYKLSFRRQGNSPNDDRVGLIMITVLFWVGPVNLLYSQMAPNMVSIFKLCLDLYTFCIRLFCKSLLPTYQKPIQAPCSHCFLVGHGTK